MPPVGAILLNYSGIGNVQVSALVSKLGDADLTNVRVQLVRSLDDGPFLAPGQSTVLDSLPAGAATLVTFTSDGLAGLNRYRVIADRPQEKIDSDRSNNVGQAILEVQGLPDLVVGKITPVPPSPDQGPLTGLSAQISNTGI